MHGALRPSPAATGGSTPAKGQRCAELNMGYACLTCSQLGRTYISTVASNDQQVEWAQCIICYRRERFLCMQRFLAKGVGPGGHPSMFSCPLQLLLATLRHLHMPAHNTVGHTALVPTTLLPIAARCEQGRILQLRTGRGRSCWPKASAPSAEH